MQGQVEEDSVKSKVMKVASQESWDSVVNEANSQGTPVVVHFTAEWCKPSVVMNQLFEELSFVHEDIMFLSVDVDEVKEVASKMEVKAMPTFVLLRNGTQVDKLVGANPEEIKKRIDGFAHSFRALKLS